MAIRVLDISNASKSVDDSDGIVGQLVNGVGMVPDYRDLKALALRFDDLDIAEQFYQAFEAAGVAVVLEDHGEKRPHHVILAEGVKLPFKVSFLRTRMELHSRADFALVRECDGVTMADGAECVCAKLADHGTQEMRKAQGDGLACKPTGFIVGSVNLPGLEEYSISFSKGSESAVRPFLELEDKHAPPFVTQVGIRTIESKKTGFSWSVPTFADTKAVEDDGPF
tara:strand:+ start:1966 stop:2640 length:675 start_codon:yes stop_codon:yes gene_type:complete